MLECQSHWPLQGGHVCIQCSLLTWAAHGGACQQAPKSFCHPAALQVNDIIAPTVGFYRAGISSVCLCLRHSLSPFPREKGGNTTTGSTTDTVPASSHIHSGSEHMHTQHQPSYMSKRQVGLHTVTLAQNTEAPILQTNSYAEQKEGASRTHEEETRLKSSRLLRRSSNYLKVTDN